MPGAPCARVRARICSVVAGTAVLADCSVVAGAAALADCSSCLWTMLVDLLMLVVIARGVACAAALGLGDCGCVLEGLVAVASESWRIVLLLMPSMLLWAQAADGTLPCRAPAPRVCGGRDTARASAMRHLGLVHGTGPLRRQRRRAELCHVR